MGDRTVGLLQKQKQHLRLSPALPLRGYAALPRNIRGGRYKGLSGLAGHRRYPDSGDSDEQIPSADNKAGLRAKEGKEEPGYALEDEENRPECTRDDPQQQSQLPRHA